MEVVEVLKKGNMMTLNVRRCFNLLIIVNNHKLLYASSLFFFPSFLTVVSVALSYLLDKFYFLLWMYTPISLYVPLDRGYVTHDFWRTTEVSERNKCPCGCPWCGVDVYHVCCWGGTYVFYTMWMLFTIKIVKLVLMLIMISNIMMMMKYNKIW